jgi:hypothetical protein
LATEGIGRVASFRYKNAKNKALTKFPFTNLIFELNENVEFYLHPFFEVSPTRSLKLIQNLDYFIASDYRFTLQKSVVNLDTMMVDRQVKF